MTLIDAFKRSGPRTALDTLYQDSCYKTRSPGADARKPAEAILIKHPVVSLTTALCLVRWQVAQHHRTGVLKSLGAMTDGDIARDMNGVKLLGSWYDLSRGTAALIAETRDSGAITEFLLHWNGAIDILGVTPVPDDDEAHKVIHSKGWQFSEILYR